MLDPWPTDAVVVRTWIRNRQKKGVWLMNNRAMRNAPVVWWTLLSLQTLTLELRHVKGSSIGKVILRKQIQFCAYRIRTLPQRIPGMCSKTRSTTDTDVKP